MIVFDICCVSTIITQVAHGPIFLPDLIRLTMGPAEDTDNQYIKIKDAHTHMLRAKPAEPSTSAEPAAHLMYMGLGPLSSERCCQGKEGSAMLNFNTFFLVKS